MVWVYMYVCIYNTGIGAFDVKSTGTFGSVVFSIMVVWCFLVVWYLLWCFW